MPIRYDLNPSVKPQPDVVLKLFDQAGISKPQWTASRMLKSIAGSAAIVCAWHDEELVGFASAISDHAWIAYITQLAVKPEFQRNGIGERLIAEILTSLGRGVTVVVHSSKGAAEFYSAIGFQSYTNVFVKAREV